MQFEFENEFKKIKIDDTVSKLLETHQTEPNYFINYHKIGRGLARSISVQKNENVATIQKTKMVTIWRIEDKNLSQITNLREVGIFFDQEAFTIKWTIELKSIDGTEHEEILVYYWRGENAPKGFSPLPSDIEEHYPVERIWQWSEPALFFHMFTQNIMTVFSGKKENFNPNIPHLFIILGELESELHVFEIPAEKQNLRSKASFLLVNPTKESFVYWIGSHTTEAYKKSVQKKKPHETLENYVKYWRDFKVTEISEGTTIELSINAALNGHFEDYHHYHRTKNDVHFTPRLFYLNSITGEFLASEIEYPLLIKDVTAAFPFTQSHLYSATQPALFLLDYNTELWLWQGWKSIDYEPETFKKDLDTAVELTKKYASMKEELLGEHVVIKHIYAGFEPKEFTNIFPTWVRKKVKEEAPLNKKQ